ncbi:MAG: hypothetical protein KDD13_00265 [Mangrovimonas sp.]|nr:hypothetical protein [Mangrovimonas sp.]
MAKFDDALNASREEQETVESNEPEQGGEEAVEAEESSEEVKEAQEDQDSQKEEQKVPLAAMMAERDKRKELEVEFRHLQKQLDEVKAKREEQEEIDPDSDPVAYYSQREQKLVRALEDKIYGMSVSYAKARWSDYDEKEAIFLEAAQKDPTLGQKMAQAGDPATFAYETAKALELQKKYGDNPESWRAAIAKEERAKLEAELKGNKQNLDKARAKQPSNLNDLRSAGGNETASYKPFTFGDALPKK